MERMERYSLELRGFNLPAVDRNGKSDPYFNVFKEGSHKKKEKVYHSETIYEALNPKWKPTVLRRVLVPFTCPNHEHVILIFHVNLYCSDLANTKILIEVKDWSLLSSWVLQNNKLLGQTKELSISDLVKGSRLDLFNEAGTRIDGYLVVSVFGALKAMKAANSEKMAHGPDTEQQEADSVDAVPTALLVAVVAAKIGMDVASATADVAGTVLNFTFPGLSRVFSSLGMIYTMMKDCQESSNEAAELLFFCLCTRKTVSRLTSLGGDLSDDLMDKIEGAAESLENLLTTLLKIKSKTRLEMFYQQAEYAKAAATAKQKTEEALNVLMLSMQVETLSDSKEIKSSIERLLQQSKRLMKATEEQMREMERNLLQVYKQEMAALRITLQQMEERRKEMEDKHHVQIMELIKNLNNPSFSDMLSSGFPAGETAYYQHGGFDRRRRLPAKLALAEYSKTGSDVLYVLNYPAYIEVDRTDDDYEKNNPGLGFKYTVEAVLEKTEEEIKKMDNKPAKYMELMSYYAKLKANDRMKAAMTDIAFQVVNRVWEDLPIEAPATARGKVYLCIGGVNSVNPFSCTTIKHDVFHFAETLPAVADIHRLDPVEGHIYDSSGKVCKLSVLLESCQELYVDYNGSMAFMTTDWQDKLFDSKIAVKIKGVFVMGGVYDDVVPMTIPSIPGVINPCSSTTMNQLYHPKYVGEFFERIAQHSLGGKNSRKQDTSLSHIPVFFITNNVIGDLTTMDFANNKTFDGVQKFLESNRLSGAYLTQVARLLYLGPNRAKPFDFYTALALVTFMKEVSASSSSEAGSDGQSLLVIPSRNLFFDPSHGLTLVSTANSWNAVVKSYSSVMKEACKGKTAQATTEAFMKEIKYMKRAKPNNKQPYMEVKSVQFSLDPETNELSLNIPSRESLEE